MRADEGLAYEEIAAAPDRVAERTRLSAPRRVTAAKVATRAQRPYARAREAESVIPMKGPA
jgi:hypothetical protein